MRTFPVRYLQIVGLVCVAITLNAADEPTMPPGVSYRVRGSFNYGPVDGFLQTPLGGEPGSSSHNRPTLNELGIDDALFYDVQVQVQLHHLGVYAGGQLIDLSGHSALSKTLVSGSKVFPAGTAVNSTTDLNWLRLGAGWKFELGNQRLELFPKAEVAGLNFDYRLTGGGVTEARSYVKACGRLGLEARYEVNRVVSLSLDGGASLPVSDTPQIASVVGAIEFKVLPNQKRFQPVFFVGCGGQWIEYEDSQRLPNHFKVTLGPFVTSGVRISF